MSNEIDYVDFEITVQKAGQDEYIVRAESGEGEAEARFINPFNEDKLALIDATLTKVALRSSARVRSSSAPEVRKMREVGAALFEQAITGPVREFYYKCQGHADQQGKGIRWRLALDTSVGDLPWEFMYLQDEFLALNPRSPIVRYIKGAARVAPLKAEHPLRLLVVIASPSDETPLDAATEKSRIETALKPLTTKNLLDVTFIEGPDTWERLIDALLPNRTHILHFIGHGAFDEKNGEGVLVMEDAEGKGARIDSERLRVLVQGKSRLRLVVLNSCLGTSGDVAQPFSSMAAGLVRSGVPAVIAMQFEISDQAAREIAETFYTSLALNYPVDAALTEARRKIFLSDRDSLEWATPILYMQVPDGRLFQFTLDNAGLVDTGPVDQPAETIAMLVRSDTGQEIGLSGDRIRIGRGPDNDIVFSESTVSRKHATLLREGSSYAIENAARSSGTWVNGQKISQRTMLKENDQIRLGAVELSFRPVPTAAPAKKARAARTTARTIIPDVAEDESLSAKAEKKYKVAEAAMGRGEWATAATAFKGALYFVPNYRDAAQKLLICENRGKAATLYYQAQRLCAAKNYDQALQALAEAARLDPSLVDAANVKESAECGRKYQQAIVELQRGNRASGADLLREVISSRADFEDAARRLDNLAEGGDGLLGFPALQPTTTPLTNQPAPSGPAPGSSFDLRRYEIINPDAKALAEEIRQHFFINGHESQAIQHSSVWVVQGQKTGFRSWLGMGLAATVMIEPAGNTLKVSIGGGKWLEQGAGLAVGALVLWPLLITGGVGMAQQKKLIDTLWRMADNFVMTRGGKRVA
jgi:tetratricopeptide (TPR) repeat protein